MTHEHLPDPIPEQAQAIADWWIEERTGWPMSRAVIAWLNDPELGNYWWDGHDPDDRARFDAWDDAVYAAASERGFK